MDNPLKAKFHVPTHTSFPQLHLPSIPALVMGICKIIFLRELIYIISSQSIQDPQLPWQYLWQKRDERAKERKEK